MTVDTEIIATALGRAFDSIAETEDAQWSMWIDDALMLIEARLGDPAELDQARLDYVVREAVVAHIKNPDNATQVSQTLGDASESKTYRTSKGRVVILDEWWNLLSPEDGQAGAFVIDTFGSASVHLPWCSVNFGADYCSCGADIAGYPIYENVP